MRLIETLTRAKHAIWRTPVGFLFLIAILGNGSGISFTGLIKNQFSFDKRLPGVTDVLSNAFDFAEIQIENTNDAFYKLPVFVYYNPGFQLPKAQIYTTEGFSNLDQVPFEGPYPRSPWGAWGLDCNPEWTIEGAFKGTNGLLNQNMRDLSSDTSRKWSFLIGQYAFHYGEITRMEAITMKTLSGFSIKKLEYCLFNSLPMFNLAGTATDLKNTNAKTLKRLGVMHAKQSHSFIWDSAAKNYTSLDAHIDFSTIIACADDSCFSGTTDCTCKYKSGVYDAVNLWEQYKVLTGWPNQGEKRKPIFMTYSIWRLAMGYILALFWYPHKHRNFLGYLMNKYLFIIISIVRINYMLKNTRTFMNFMEPICFKNPMTNANPTYWDEISSVIPNWNCVNHQGRVFNYDCYISHFLVAIIHVLVVSLLS